MAPPGAPLIAIRREPDCCLRSKVQSFRAAPLRGLPGMTPVFAPLLRRSVPK